jgi:hypothetical protein
MVSRPSGCSWPTRRPSERAALDGILSKGSMTTREARRVRRAGRFRAIRLAGRGENLYQDIETQEFWALREGAVVRLVGVDGSGLIAKEARAAGGTTGYYRDERVQRSPGTYNDGAGEKDVDKFAGDDEEGDGLQEESNIGMRPDRDLQERPFNYNSGAGAIGLCTASERPAPFKKGDWVVDGAEEEFQVARDQTPEGSVDVVDGSGKRRKHPRPQELAPKTTASVAGMRRNQAADLVDLGFAGPQRGARAGRGSAVLDGLEVSDVAAVTHRVEMDRIVALGQVAPRAARALRRVGRFEPVERGMYRDTASGDLWFRDGGEVRRAAPEAVAKKASAGAGRSRSAAWSVIDSVLRREEGWVPEFRAGEDREAAGIHLDDPTADDVMEAIHAAREQGFQTVHVH